MMILAIDTGVTTAYAILENNLVTRIGSIHCPIGSSNIQLIAELGELLQYNFTHVVIEYAQVPTMSELNTHLKMINATIYNTFPTAKSISSGIWKQCPQSRIMMKCNKHEKDAIHIAEWYYKYVLKIR